MAYEEQAFTGAGQQAQQRISPWAAGFTVFAAAMMIISGTFQAIQGLAAIINDDFFVLGENYAFNLSTNAWGWIHLIAGIVVAVAGFALVTGAVWARVLAIVLAMLSAVANFFYIPYYPVWSIVIIAIDIGVIWALTTHGVNLTSSDQD